MKWTLILVFGWPFAEISLGWTYHYSNKTMSWSDSRQWCKTFYTDMVVIQNQIENDYLVSWLPDRTRSPYYWIGILKSHKDENWTWIGNNSTWTGENSWAANEPNNNHSTEFCVEIYVNQGVNRGKWNDEKCAKQKYPVCYKAQCNATICDRGTCHETIENVTCLCDPGFEGERCETPMKCPTLFQPNGNLSCPDGNGTANSTCEFICNPGFLMMGSAEMICEISGVWSTPMPFCANVKQVLMAIAGFGSFPTCCFISFCCLHHKKRKKLSKSRKSEEGQEMKENQNLYMNMNL